MAVKIVIQTGGIGRGSLKNARDIEFVELHLGDAASQLKS